VSKAVELAIDVAVDAAEAAAGLHHVGDGARDVAESTDQLATKTGTATGALGALAGGLDAVGLGPFASALSATAIATDVVSGASDLLTLALESNKLAWIGKTAATVASKVADVAGTAATGAMTAAQWALNAALNANPIGLVVIAIAALAAGLIYAYKHSETFRDIVNGAMEAAKTAIGWVVDQVQKYLVPAFDGALSVIKSVRDAVMDLVHWIERIHVPDLGDLKSLGGKLGGALNPFDRLATPGGAGVQININGVLNAPDAVRQLERLFGQGSTTLGRAVIL
jgi:hypothetical protein